MSIKIRVRSIFNKTLRYTLLILLSVATVIGVQMIDSIAPAFAEVPASYPTTIISANFSYIGELTAGVNTDKSETCSYSFVLALSPAWSNALNAEIQVRLTNSAGAVTAENQLPGLVVSNQQTSISIANLPESSFGSRQPLVTIKFNSQPGGEVKVGVSGSNLPQDVASNFSSTYAVIACPELNSEGLETAAENEQNISTIVSQLPVKFLEEEKCQGAVNTAECVLGSEFISEATRELPQPINEFLSELTLAGSIAALSSSTVLLNLLNIVLFLRSPLLVFSFLTTILTRNKVRPWGIVLDAKTSKPIAFTTLRLFSKSTKILLETKVTDLQGRYGFAVKDGEYFLEVEHPLYKKYVIDEVLLEKGGLIDKDIKLISTDARRPLWSYVIPSSLVEPPRLVKFRNFIFALGFIFSLLAILISASFFNIVILLINLLQGLVIAVFALRRPRSWGKVIDFSTDAGVVGAHVKIYSDKGELIDSQITNYEGSFGLILDPGNYLFSVEALGYKFPAKNQETMLDKANKLNANLIKIEFSQGKLSKGVNLYLEKA